MACDGQQEKGAVGIEIGLVHFGPKDDEEESAGSSTTDYTTGTGDRGSRSSTTDYTAGTEEEPAVELEQPMSPGQRDRQCQELLQSLAQMRKREQVLRQVQAQMDAAHMSEIAEHKERNAVLAARCKELEKSGAMSQELNAALVARYKELETKLANHLRRVEEQESEAAGLEVTIVKMAQAADASSHTIHQLEQGMAVGAQSIRQLEEAIAVRNALMHNQDRRIEIREQEHRLQLMKLQSTIEKISGKAEGTEVEVGLVCLKEIVMAMKRSERDYHFQRVAYATAAAAAKPDGNDEHVLMAELEASNAVLEAAARKLSKREEELMQVENEACAAAVAAAAAALQPPAEAPHLAELPLSPEGRVPASPLRGMSRATTKERPTSKDCSPSRDSPGRQLRSPHAAPRPHGQQLSTEPQPAPMDEGLPWTSARQEPSGSGSVSPARSPERRLIAVVGSEQSAVPPQSPAGQESAMRSKDPSPARSVATSPTRSVSGMPASSKDMSPTQSYSRHPKTGVQDEGLASAVSHRVSNDHPVQPSESQLESLVRVSQSAVRSPSAEAACSPNRGRASLGGTAGRARREGAVARTQSALIAASKPAAGEGGVARLQSAAPATSRPTAPRCASRPQPGATAPAGSPDTNASPHHPGPALPADHLLESPGQNVKPGTPQPGTPMMTPGTPMLASGTMTARSPVVRAVSNRVIYNGSASATIPSSRGRDMHANREKPEAVAIRDAEGGLWTASTITTCMSPGLPARLGSVAETPLVPFGHAPGRPQPLSQGPSRAASLAGSMLLSSKAAMNFLQQRQMLVQPPVCVAPPPEAQANPDVKDRSAAKVPLMPTPKRNILTAEI